MIHLQVVVCNHGQHKNEADAQTDHARISTHCCINTHGQYTTPTCPKCAYKICANGFTLPRSPLNCALAEKPRNPQKINVPRIHYPRLQYWQGTLVCPVYQACTKLCYFAYGAVINSTIVIASTYCGKYAVPFFMGHPV